MSLELDRGGLTTLNEPSNSDFKIFDRGGVYTYVAAAAPTGPNIKFGSTAISKVYLGTNQIAKVYLGSTQL